MTKNISIKGQLFALTANVMWGLMAPIGKSALEFFSPLCITTFRMVGAGIAFWIVSLFYKNEKVNLKDLLWIGGAACFALIFNQGIFIFGLSLTSPIDASIITTTLPIFTMIVAAFYLKEPITKKKVSGIFLGAMGAIILILGSQISSNGTSSILGNVLCLSAQLCFSIYLTVFKKLTQRYSAITINKWMFVYATLFYFPLSFQEISAIEWTTIPYEPILQTLYVVFGGSFVAYLCVMSAQRLLAPTMVSMYNYTQPIVATIATLIIGIGTFNWTKAFAILLVFLGVYIVTQSRRKEEQKTQ